MTLDPKLEISGSLILTALSCLFYSTALNRDTAATFQHSLSPESQCTDAFFGFLSLLCCSTTSSGCLNLRNGFFLRQATSRESCVLLQSIRRV